MKNFFDKMLFLSRRGFRTVSWGVVEAPARPLYDLEHSVMDDLADRYGVTFIGLEHYEEQRIPIHS